MVNKVRSQACLSSTSVRNYLADDAPQCWAHVVQSGCHPESGQRTSTIVRFGLHCVLSWGEERYRLSETVFFRFASRTEVSCPTLNYWKLQLTPITLKLLWRLFSLQWKLQLDSRGLHSDCHWKTIRVKYTIYSQLKKKTKKKFI